MVFLPFHFERIFVCLILRFMNIANTLKIDRNSKIAFTIHIYYKLRS